MCTRDVSVAIYVSYIATLTSLVHMSLTTVIYSKLFSLFLLLQWDLAGLAFLFAAIQVICFVW